MTYAQAQATFDSFYQHLDRAVAAVDSARNLNWSNGAFAPWPRIAEARAHLDAALSMLDQVRQADRAMS